MSTPIWKLFPEVVERVRRSHIEAKCFGAHDFEHPLRVANVAIQIVLADYPGQEKLVSIAGLAGLCHNADRVLQVKLKLHREKPRQEAIIALIREWLHGYVVEHEALRIVDAVLKHSHINHNFDSVELIILMDADRVVNLDVDLFFRSALHFPDKPPVDYRHPSGDPNSDYRNPPSIMDDARSSLDWVDFSSRVCVRTPTGKRLALKRSSLFRECVLTLSEQLAEEWLYPYPFDPSH